jgi:hypothetical protein
MSDLRDAKDLTLEEELAISAGYHELARRRKPGCSEKSRLDDLGEWWGARAYRTFIREQRERDYAKSQVRG